LLLALGGWGLAPAAIAAEDDFGGLPKGPGQEDVYAICAACHSIKLVLQQRLSRADWDEALDYMVAEQAMEKLDAEDRKIVLDYLGKYLGRDAPR
jgi:cytochrome c